MFVFGPVGCGKDILINNLLIKENLIVKHFSLFAFNNKNTENNVKLNDTDLLIETFFNDYSVKTNNIFSVDLNPAIFSFK